MDESNDWLPWWDSAAGKLSRSTFQMWRNKNSRRFALKEGIHWRYGRNEYNKRIILINSQLVTPKFIREHYHPIYATSRRALGELTEDEVRRLVQLFESKEQEIPDYLIPACKRFEIPIPENSDGTKF